MVEFKGGISKITLAAGGQVYVQYCSTPTLQIHFIGTPTKCPRQGQGTLFLFPLRGICAAFQPERACNECGWGHLSASSSQYVVLPYLILKLHLQYAYLWSAVKRETIVDRHGSTSINVLNVVCEAGRASGTTDTMSCTSVRLDVIFSASIISRDLFMESN
jgi:hypothetical protein